MNAAKWMNAWRRDGRRRPRMVGLGLVLVASTLVAQAEDATPRQLELLTANCLQCHARADTGAPQMGQPKDWVERVARGEDALLVSTVEGVRGMPPLGYCGACDEADFRALIRLLGGSAASGVRP